MKITPHKAIATMEIHLPAGPVMVVHHLLKRAGKFRDAPGSGGNVGKDEKAGQKTQDDEFTFGKVVK
jgi:hypothetical protein